MQTATQERPVTYGDYLTWTDDVRYEIINGVSYAMSPAPSTHHQRVVMALLAQIYDYLTDRDCEVFPAPFDVRLPDTPQTADHAVTTVVQPDISVVCDPDKLDDRGCLGAPDFIIEVASPSTASRDHIEKVALYEKHGVKEYWIVHPVDRLLYIRRLQEDGLYGRSDIREGKGCHEVSALAGLRLDLGVVFPPLESKTAPPI